MKSAVHREGDHICCPRDLFHSSAGGLDQIGTGLVSPGDLSIDTDAETIKNYLHETEEYDNEWGSCISAQPAPLVSIGLV